MAFLQLVADHVVERAVGCGLLCGLLLVTGYRLWPQRQQVKRLLCDYLRLLTPCAMKSMNADPVERRVMEELRRRRLERAHLVTVLANSLAAFQVFLWVLFITLDEPTGTFAETVNFYLYVSVVGFVTLFHSAITHRTIDGIYSATMLILLVQTLLREPEPLHITAKPPNCLLMTFLWSFFDMRIWLNLLWLTVMSLASSVPMLLDGQSCIFTAASYAVAVGILLWMDYCLKAAVRLEIIASDSNNQLVAVKTMLNSICDVVVELDEGLRLIEHSPKLADVLMQAPFRSLQGVELREFLPEEADRETFAQHMRMDESAARADVFHVQMRDSAGCKIAMELFSVAFRGSDSKHRFILGMREFTDINPVTQPGQRAPPPPPRVQAPLPRPPRDARPVASRGTPSAASEHGDLGDLRSVTASSKSSPRNSEQSADVEPAPRAPRLVETTDVAKKTTIIYALSSWWMPPSHDDCCPWHAALNEAQRMIGVMMRGACDRNYEPAHAWQCRRCGVTAEDYRDKKHKKWCLICKNLARDKLTVTRKVAAASSGAAGGEERGGAPGVERGEAHGEARREARDTTTSDMRGDDLV